MEDNDYKLIIPTHYLHTIMELLAEHEPDIMEDLLNQVGEEFRPGYIPNDDEHDQFRSDAEADGDALASAGMGTDEDYEHPGMDDDC